MNAVDWTTDMLIQWTIKPTKTVMECEFEFPKLDMMGKSGNPDKGKTHFFSFSHLLFMGKLGS